MGILRMKSTQICAFMLLGLCLASCDSMQSRRFESLLEQDTKLLTEQSLVTPTWSADFSRLNLCISHLCPTEARYEICESMKCNEWEPDGGAMENALPCDHCRALANKELKLQWKLGGEQLKEQKTETDSLGDLTIDRSSILNLYAQASKEWKTQPAEIQILYEERTVLKIELEPGFFDRSLQLKKLETESKKLETETK